MSVCVCVRHRELKEGEREEGVFIAFACLPGDREGIAKIKGKVNEIIYKQMSCKL
jgi:hypothetical protein